MKQDRQKRPPETVQDNRMRECCPAKLVQQALESEFADESVLEAALDRLEGCNSRVPEQADDILISWGR